MRRRRALVAAPLALGLAAAGARAQQPSPQAHDIPRWFTESFLDFKEEAAEAARQGKRLMLYFGQDGCPYCRELLVNSFSQKAIVDRAEPKIMAVALNIWGDREVTWVDGRRYSEKDFARLLNVQFTPTLLFLDEQARTIGRLNGYQAPARVAAALDFAIGRLERRTTLAEHLATLPADKARPQLAPQPFFLSTDDLRRSRGDRTLAVLFESRSCTPCDELHDEGFQRASVRQWLPRLDVVRLALTDTRGLTTPAGQRLTAAQWARALGVNYTPSWVFFADDGREVFRVEGYLRPFHLAGSLEYAASAGWRREPQFQRWLQAKAERERAAGRPVEYWR